MRHVRDRVDELRVGERAARPVGEAVRLFEMVAGDALHQLVVGDGVAIAEDHGGDLRVEDRVRDLARHVPDDLDVLPGCMEPLDDVLVVEQREERVEVDILSERVDDHRFVLARHLGNAEQGVVGTLAQELGVYGDVVLARHALADGAQFPGRRNRHHVGRYPKRIRGGAGNPSHRLRTGGMWMNSHGLGICPTGTSMSVGARAAKLSRSAPRSSSGVRARTPRAPKLSAYLTKSGLARSQAISRLPKRSCWMRRTLPK